MENKREILRVVDLEKKFHKLEVLKGINVSFHENEVVSIISTIFLLTRPDKNTAS